MTPYTSPREPDEYNLARCAEGRSIQAYPAHEPGNGTASIIHPAAGRMIGERKESRVRLPEVASGQGVSPETTFTSSWYRGGGDRSHKP